MIPRPATFALPCARKVALHCLGWMLAANLAGFWLGLRRQNSVVAEAVRFSPPRADETLTRSATKPGHDSKGDFADETANSRGGGTLPPLPGRIDLGRNPGWALGASWLVFALIDRGDVSHHAPARIAALAVLLAWVPLLPYFWSRQVWPEETRAWWGAAAGWGAPPRIWGCAAVQAWMLGRGIEGDE